MLDTPQSSTRHIPWSRIITYTIVVVGTILNLFFIVPNGDYSCQSGVCGIRIGEWHYHDAMWHIAVARNSFQSFPFIFPSAAGFALTSYNYLLGAILFLLEIARIGPFFTYFKLLPVLGNIALIYSLFRYYRITKKTDLEQLWISFFVYLGSSFSFLLILYRNDFADFSILKGFPVVATLQPAFVLSNVQFFLSLPIILYAFTSIFLKKSSKTTILIQSILLTLAVGLKIYSGMFVILMLLVGSIVRNISIRTYKQILIDSLWYIFVFFASALVFYLPLDSQYRGFPFIWSPISIPHAITESPGLFYHKNFTLGLYFMHGLQKISYRLILYESISITLFILWNLGSRVIFVVGLIYTIFKKQLALEQGFLLIFGLIGLLIPTFFIQKGGGWYNTIQFAYIGVYFIGILAGIYVAKMWANGHFVLKLLVIVTLLLTLPNNILMFKLLAMKKIVIPIAEINALEFLRSQPRGVVLSFPDDKNSSYVPALSAKVGYMIDYEQADLLNIATNNRVQDVENRACSVLGEIDYLYLNSARGKEYINCTNFIPKFRQIYDRNLISIYRRR